MNLLEAISWKSIEGFPLYAVHEDGRIYSFRKNKIMIQKITKSGYCEISLVDENKKEKTVLCHRIVAKAFIPNIFNKIQVNHIDGNKRNNHCKNLEWVSASENAKHAYKIGLNHFCNKDIENLKIIQEKNKRPILKIDKKTKEIIQSYPSIKEAAIDNKISNKGIHACCKKAVKTYKGHIWAYREEYINE